MPEQQEENLADYVFSVDDLPVLVELCNRVYETGRQHPSLQPALKSWMKDFVSFMKAHVKTPELEANPYIDLAKQLTVNEITEKMKENQDARKEH